MNRLTYSTVVLAVAAAALVVPATLFAQGDPAPRGGAGTNLPGGGGGGGAAGGGAAVSRPEASGGGTPSSGSSGGSTGGSTWNGGGSSGSYGGGWTNPDTRRAAALENARRRSDAREDNGGRRYGAGADAGTSGDAVNRSVPWYSRSREGRPIVGTAAGREEVGRPGRPNAGGGYTSGYDYYGSYGYGYGYGNYGYRNCQMYGFGAYGMGYFFYDPYWWTGRSYAPGCAGYLSPDSYYPGYLGYGGYGGGYRGGYWGGSSYWPDYGGGGGGSYSGESSPGTNASLKLKVKPNNAQVFIDGYFAGSVDDFDGMFQKLPVRPGEHRLEFRAPGYEALVTDVRVDPYEIFSVKAELKRK